MVLEKIDLEIIYIYFNSIQTDPINHDPCLDKQLDRIWLDMAAYPNRAILSRRTFKFEKKPFWGENEPAF